MHDTAYAFVRRTLAMLPQRKRVCEFGSYNVNGSARPLFVGCEKYVGIDIRPGPGVDIVDDAATWEPPDGKFFDTVVSTEVLEHCSVEDQQRIIHNAHWVIRERGVFLLTAATDPRPIHSVDGHSTLPEGEVYCNVSLEHLRLWLGKWHCAMIDVSISGDVYAVAVA